MPRTARGEASACRANFTQYYKQTLSSIVIIFLITVIDSIFILIIWNQENKIYSNVSSFERQQNLQQQQQQLNWTDYGTNKNKQRVQLFGEIRRRLICKNFKRIKNGRYKTFAKESENITSVTTLSEEPTLDVSERINRR